MISHQTTQFIVWLSVPVQSTAWSGSTRI